MKERNKELAANTFILGIGQLVPKFLNLALLPILTTYLSTDAYGNYDLILSFISLVIPVVTLQIQQAVFRYLLSSKENEDRTKYVTNSVIYIVGSSIICFPALFVILRLLKMQFEISIFICLLFLGSTVYNLLGQIVRGLGYNKKYSIGVIVYSVMNLVATLVMLMVFQMRLQGVIIALSIGYFGSDMYMILTSGMLKYIKLSRIRKNTMKELLAFSAPIVPSSIALWVVNLSDRLVIIHFLGAAANGIYAVANKVPLLYGSVYSIFNLAWTETATKVSDDGDPAQYYTKLFHTLYEFLVGVMLFLIAATPLIFKILVRGDYGVAVYQVPILYVGIFFNSFVNFYSGIYIALKRTKQVGISSLVGALLNLIINILFVRQIGIYAASISTAISFFIIAIYRAYDLNKVIKIEYQFGSILLGMCCFGISGVCLFIGNFYLLLLCWVIAVIYNMKKNLKFVRGIALLCMKKVTT